MTEPKYTYETKAEVWDNESGSHLEIGPDRDGLDLLEIRRHNEEGAIGERIVFDNDEAAMIIRALREQLKIRGYKGGDGSAVTNHS